MVVYHLQVNFTFLQCFPPFFSPSVLYHDPGKFSFVDWDEGRHNWTNWTCLWRIVKWRFLLAYSTKLIKGYQRPWELRVRSVTRFPRGVVLTVTHMGLPQIDRPEVRWPAGSDKRNKQNRVCVSIRVKSRDMSVLHRPQLMNRFVHVSRGPDMIWNWRLSGLSVLDMTNMFSSGE